MLAQGCRALAEVAACNQLRNGVSELIQMSPSALCALRASTPAEASPSGRAALSSRFVNTRTSEDELDPSRIGFVFLGPPGVGKGTYSTRVAIALGVSHIAAGDLVRYEMRSGSRVGQSMERIVNQGNLLPDDMITELLLRRIERGKEAGEKGFVLDGFPRTVQQAEALMAAEDVQLAVNLMLREEVLIEKCMGRRICRKCGKGWNLADIYLPAKGERPEIVMPPLDPPVDCIPFMEQREDDKEEVIRRRLDVHNSQAQPVKNFYEKKGKLMNFEITGGIPETLPLLYNALRPHCGNWTLADFEAATMASATTDSAVPRAVG